MQKYICVYIGFIFIPTLVATSYYHIFCVRKWRKLFFFDRLTNPFDKCVDMKCKSCHSYGAKVYELPKLNVI